MDIIARGNHKHGYNGVIVNRVPIQNDCDHTDGYGSMIMEGGPYSRYPGMLMCIGCDQPAPFLSLLTFKEETILTCNHNHQTTDEARECAKEILNRVYLDDSNE